MDGWRQIDSLRQRVRSPFFLELLELSPHARKRHMMLAGVYTGKKNVLSNYILKPIVQELNSLYYEGITLTLYEGGRRQTSKFITCILLCDSDA